VSDLLSEHPELESFVLAAKAQDDKIEYTENQLKISENGFRNKILELKAMLRTNLNDLERSVVKLVIKDTQKDARNTKKRNLKVFGEHTKAINVTRKKIAKSKKLRIGSLKVELKEQLKDEKMQQTEIRRAEKQLTKVARLQDDYADDIQHGLIKDLVKKYSDKMEDDLQAEFKKKADKIKQREQTAADKATRKLQKNTENLQKKEQTAADKKTRKMHKDAENQKKKEQTAADKKTRKMHKDAEKARKTADRKTK
jgi:hypothetical protein